MITRRKFLGGLLASTAALVLPIKAIAELIPKPSVPKMMTSHYSMEDAHKMRSLHGIDMEKRLTNMLAEEMAKEIDDEILRRMVNE